MRRKKLYLASPLFSHSERVTNDVICRALEKTCDVFLPQRDGELVTHLIHQGLSEVDAYRIVFERDISAINSCDGVVVNLDGRTVDEGAAFELGYAFALRKQCVGYRTDVRVLLPWGQNPMVCVPLLHVFNCVETLEVWARNFSADHAQCKPRLVAG